MLDIVEIQPPVMDFDEFYIPWRVDKGNLYGRSDVFDAMERIVVDDEFERKSIVGIDPVSDLFITAPGIFIRRVCCQGVQKSSEHQAVLLKPLIINQPLLIHKFFKYGVPEVIVRWRGAVSRRGRHINTP